MKLFEKKHAVAGQGCLYVLTAEQLCQRAKDEIKGSNYNWTISASEFVRVCAKPDFPEKYAKEIKCAILYSLACMECRKENYPSYGTPEDYQAAYYCYNSLSGTEISIVAAKERYLDSFIESIAKYHFDYRDFPHFGPTYRELCNEWIRSKFYAYRFVGQINFEKLRKELDDDFDKIMKKAEAEGRFEKEDKEVVEYLLKVF